MGMIMIIALIVVKIYLDLFCARHHINCFLFIIINPYNHLQSSFFFLTSVLQMMKLSHEVILRSYSLCQSGNQNPGHSDF